jgi:nitrogenase-stabilizing/protective protein
MTGSSQSAAHEGILAKLRAASSAEDFFTLLGVAYDAQVVNVARLHILKRMGQYLASENFTGLPDSEVSGRCKGMLERAYQDFVASSPIDQRVFKVLKEAVAPPKPANFVPLDALFK